MDPISIVSLASNVMQFIDFTAQLVSKGNKIGESAHGGMRATP